MLDQPYMTDLIEANSMGHEPNLIDIYSASWGPTDDGKTVDGPRNATMRAIVRGVNEVRTILFWILFIQDVPLVSERPISRHNKFYAAKYIKMHKPKIFFIIHGVSIFLN